MLDTNPDSDSSLTPEDAAAAIAIAMSITGQKTAGAALDAASAAAQAIMLQTTIGEKIHDGTPPTEIPRAKQTNFIEFRQTYPIAQRQSKECSVILGSLELKNDSLPSSVPEVAIIQTIVLVVMHVNLT